MKTRITEMLNIEIPIVQAPMGYIARAQLASAVSNAGGLGIIETGSGKLDEIKLEFEKMRDLTDKPWGVNVPQLFVRDPAVVDFIVDNGVRFVTTSAGDPAKMVPLFKQAGITVFHVVPTLRGAIKAIEAGVDGPRRRRHRRRRVQESRRRVDDGARAAHRGQGRCADHRGRRHLRWRVDGRRVRARRRWCADGHAHGVERRVADPRQLEAARGRLVRDRHGRGQPVRQAVDAGAAYRGRSIAAERDPEASKMVPDSIFKLYFGGDMEAFFAFGGQVAGRIDRVEPVREILTTAWTECQQRLRDLGRWASED